MVRRRPAAAEDHHEFEELYRRELAAMIALATTLTGDRDGAVDVAQEALARAFRDWADVGRLDRPGAWVRRVVINLSIDAHRRAGRDVAVGPMLAREDVANVPNESSTADVFWSAVRALPERQRASVALYYLEDRSVVEIADILGVTAGTVKTSLFMARRNLAASLGAEEVAG